MRAMNLSIAVMALLMIATTATFSRSPLCSNSCSGCLFIMPKIKQAGIDIDTEFQKVEERIAKRYHDEIIPLLQDNKKLDREITSLEAQLEVLQRKILMVDEEIILTLSSIKSIKKTNQKAKEVKQ